MKEQKRICKNITQEEALDKLSTYKDFREKGILKKLHECDAENKYSILISEDELQALQYLGCVTLNSNCDFDNTDTRSYFICYGYIEPTCHLNKNEILDAVEFATVTGALAFTQSLIDNTWGCIIDVKYYKSRSIFEKRIPISCLIMSNMRMIDMASMGTTIYPFFKIFSPYALLSNLKPKFKIHIEYVGEAITEQQKEDDWEVLVKHSIINSLKID